MSADDRYRVLAVPGSLRRASINRSLAVAAAQVAPVGMAVDVYDRLGEVPLFNADLEGLESDPRGVVAIRRAVDDADGVLIATPEYNGSVPGVVKNLLDWLSRSPVGSLKGKPTAVIGATPGRWGTRGAQRALAEMLVQVGAHQMNSNRLFVPSASSAFEDGELVDERVRKGLSETMVGFGRWIDFVRAGTESWD